MKALFTLIPSESKRLIGKAVVQMAEVKTAKEKGYVIINGGTTNAYVAQELLGVKAPTPQKYTAGISSHRLLCVTDADKRTPFPIILQRGKIQQDAGRDFPGLSQRDCYYQGSQRHRLERKSRGHIFRV